VRAGALESLGMRRVGSSAVKARRGGGCVVTGERSAKRNTETILANSGIIHLSAHTPTKPPERQISLTTLHESSQW
jgi:hypothetical protein